MNLGPVGEILPAPLLWRLVMLSLGHDAAGHEELVRMQRRMAKAQKEAEHQEWVRQRKEAEIRQAWKERQRKGRMH